MKEKDPLVFIIFGATGDLAQKKILPALLDLYSRDLLPQDFKIVGFSRKDLSHDDYREFVVNAVKNNGNKHSDKEINGLIENVYYKQGDVTNVEAYHSLSMFLSEIDEKIGVCTNKIFYLAITPNLYNFAFKNISASGLTKKCGDNGDNWTRILVEKPFGSNKDEAKKLDKTLGSLFKEKQIFRIDHYLAKETIQNILTFRFANAIFEPLWNKDYIEKIEIVLHEKDDVASRANFYDGIGALRDVGQNHLLQMAAIILMDDPKGTRADAIRVARYKALSRLVPFSRRINEFAVRGQYDGYLNHSGVAGGSKIETFFRIKLLMNDSRWKNVPIYLESGKALNEDRVEITVTFKEKTSFVCPIDEVCAYNNVLKINIQPEEKITLRFWAKKPGLFFDLEQKDLSFTYAEGQSMFADAYEKVLYDCIKGDLTLFTSTEETATEWRIISEILDKWQTLPLVKYQKGSKAADIKINF